MGHMYPRMVCFSRVAGAKMRGLLSSQHSLICFFISCSCASWQCRARHHPACELSPYKARLVHFQLCVAGDRIQQSSFLYFFPPCFSLPPCIGYSSCCSCLLLTKLVAIYLNTCYHGILHHCVFPTLLMLLLFVANNVILSRCIISHHTRRYSAGIRTQAFSWYYSSSSAVATVVQTSASSR